MLCPNCNTSNIEGAKSCKKCGKIFSAPPEPTPLPTLVPTPVPVPAPSNGHAARAEAAEAKAAIAEAAQAEAQAARVKAEAAQADAEAAKAKAETAQTDAEAKAVAAQAELNKLKKRQTGVLVGIALVAAAVGGASGYGLTSRGVSSEKVQLDQARKDLAQANTAYASSQANNTKINSDLTAAKQLAVELQGKLDAQHGDAQKSIDQLTKNLKKAAADRDQNSKQASDLQASLTATQQKLHDAEDALPQKVKQLEASTAQKIQQLTNQLKESQSEVAALTKRLPAQTNNTAVRNGTLVWSGDIRGKKTIEIKNGTVSVGALAGILPGRPCTLAPSDPSKIKIKKAPAADNQWSAFSFEISGNGPTEARFYWTAQ